MRFRTPLAVFTALMLGLLGPVGLSGTALAQDGEPTPPPVEITSCTDDDPVGDIIPKPNSGQAPETPADRGGALQLTLLALIVGFFGLAVFSVRRQMRAAGANTYHDAPSTPAPEPSAEPKG